MPTRKHTHLRRGFIAFVVVGSVALALTTATSDGARNHASPDTYFLAGSSVPVSVRAVLQRACQNCHSENTVWPWYAQIPLISGQIHSDVAKGRAFMDLSKWNRYTEGQQRGFKVAIGAAIQSQRMPPPKYVWMHSEAQLSGDERDLVRAWSFARH